MNLLKSKDPAPSRLFYKINRLFYKLWFKMLVVTFFLISGALFAIKTLHKNVDLNEEIKFLTKESSDLYKDLTKFSISRIIVQGAQEALKKEITILVQNAATEGFSALNAQALREKIQAINKVEKAFVKFSTDGLVIVSVIERKEAVVFFNNDLYEVLDSNGIILSIKPNYQGLSAFPLLVGKDASKKIEELLSLVNEIGSNKSEVFYYERIGKRRWNIHMKNDLVFKLPENNLSEALELMKTVLNETNKPLRPIVSVDLRNIEKPIIKFKKASSVEYTFKKLGGVEG